MKTIFGNQSRIGLYSARSFVPGQIVEIADAKENTAEKPSNDLQKAVQDGPREHARAFADYMLDSTETNYAIESIQSADDTGIIEAKADGSVDSADHDANRDQSDDGAKTPSNEPSCETDELPAQHCTVCGVLQTSENTSETRKGSGKLRTKCKNCTRKPYCTRKYPKATKLLFKGLTLRISAIGNKNKLPVFVENYNPVHQAVQTFFQLCPSCGQTTHESDVLFCPQCDRRDLKGEKCPFCSHLLQFARRCPDCGIVTRTISVEKDLVCKECGSVVRYDSKKNRVCDGCGLTTTASEAEIMEQARIRNSGKRMVISRRETVWKMLEYDNTVPFKSHQPSFGKAPEYGDKKAEPADVLSDDEEEETGVLKANRASKSCQGPKSGRKQRRSRKGDQDHV